MSNCDFVAAGSLIDLATSTLALRAPATAASKIVAANLDVKSGEWGARKASLL